LKENPKVMAKDREGSAGKGAEISKLDTDKVKNRATNNATLFCGSGREVNLRYANRLKLKGYTTR